MILVPVPKKFITLNSSFKPLDLNSLHEIVVVLPKLANNDRLIYHLKSIFSQSRLITDSSLTNSMASAGVPFITIHLGDNQLPPQAYKLTIMANQILIQSSSEVGAFYAITTLRQIIISTQKSGQTLIKPLEITDQPDLTIRGVMLDISRGKVMTVEEIKTQIEIMSWLKINQLQLYVEGFSYQYQSFKNLNQDLNHLTVQEFQEIEEWALWHFIDLVPNQNGFGHMTDWLKLEEYQDLKMVDGLFSIWGSHRPSSTLNPLDPRSLELVKQMYQDMLPNFKSEYFNMNFDEPFELGYGKTADACAKDGIAKVFLEFFNSCAEEVRKYKKRPMLWGDVLIKHPEALKDLPKDAIFIDWGYNQDYPFSKHLAMLKEHKVEMLAAAGTSTWSMICGKEQEMLGSINNAVEAVINNQGLGAYLTDWGDLGHLQYFLFSYPGIIYFGLTSWNYQASYQYLIKHYLSTYLGGPLLANIIIGLSRYSQLENDYRDYSCKLFYPILACEHLENETNQLEYFKTKMSYNLLTESEQFQYLTYFDCYQQLTNSLDDSIEKSEILNSILLLKNLVNFNKLIKSYLLNRDSLIQQLTSFNQEIATIQGLNHQYLLNHQILWKKRNKIEGYPSSARRINRLNQILEEIKKEVNNYE